VPCEWNLEWNGTPDDAAQSICAHARQERGAVYAGYAKLYGDPPTYYPLTPISEHDVYDPFGDGSALPPACPGGTMIPTARCAAWMIERSVTLADLAVHVHGRRHRVTPSSDASPAAASRNPIRWMSVHYDADLDIAYLAVMYFRYVTQQDPMVGPPVIVYLAAPADPVLDLRVREDYRTDGYQLLPGGCPDTDVLLSDPTVHFVDHIRGGVGPDEPMPSSPWYFDEHGSIIEHQESLYFTGRAITAEGLPRRVRGGDVMATEIPMLEDVTLFRWLSRGGTAIISVTGRDARAGARSCISRSSDGQVSALRVEARETPDETEPQSGRPTSFRDLVAQPYDPDEHGSVSIGVLHARMIKCIGIRERDGEPRYGVCPYAVLGSAGNDTRGGWGCRVCSGRRPVPLTLERARDPRLGCPRGLWEAARAV
jgi:hypothetical protein